MKVNALNADLQGASSLIFGHTQVNSLTLNMSDSSAIMLSGSAMRKLNK